MDYIWLRWTMYDFNIMDIHGLFLNFAQPQQLNVMDRMRAEQKL